MRSIFNRDELDLGPEDMKGWTALPTISHHDPDARTASQQVADLDWDLTVMLPPHTVIGGPWHPALVVVDEETEEQTVHVLPIKFDERREAQDFIAQHLIAANFLPGEDFE